jgi:hypothetical protein
MTTVPRPQQAKTRGQLVVHRTDSEQESSLDTATTTTTEQVTYYYYSTATTTTTAERAAYHYYDYYYYSYRCRDNLHPQNQKASRSIVLRINNNV